MRIRTAVLLAALVLAAPADARVLRKGVHGPRVQTIQRKLHLPIDGIFGPATKRAVKRFQTQHGLTVDGIVGPATWAALTMPAHASKAAATRSLQHALGINADGVFGPGTDRAVRAFQTRHGLTADGVVGPATWTALGHAHGPTLHETVYAGARPHVVDRIIRAANRIASKPYIYGGGHAHFPRDTGYDCSGSVAYALHGAGLLAYSMPSGAFKRWGDPGPGRWVTIYANRDHMYMVVDGRRYDTSGLSQRGTRWTTEPRSSAGFHVRHPPGL